MGVAGGVAVCSAGGSQRNQSETGLRLAHVTGVEKSGERVAKWVWPEGGQVAVQGGGGSQ